MAKVTNAFDTYTAVDKREDYIDKIYNISPSATPLLSLAGVSNASGVYHEWQTDALPSATNSGEFEGATFAGASNSATTRVGNYCMIKSRNAVVTGTQEAVQKAGVKSELAYQIAKQTAALKLDIDTCISQKASSVAGDASTARVTRGIEAFITTNQSKASDGSTTSGTVTDGTQRTFTETLLKAALQTTFTTGGNPTKMLLGAAQKAVFSGFAGRSATTVPVDAKTVEAAVDVYAGDFHRLEAVPSRNIRNRTALLIDPEFIRVAYLRKFVQKNYEELGDAKATQIITEFALQVDNEGAHSKVADLS